MKALYLFFGFSFLSFLSLSRFHGVLVRDLHHEMPLDSLFVNIYMLFLEQNFCLQQILEKPPLS